jgi:hypothetical protein
MDTATHVLVIILSVLLAFFLLLAIAAFVMVLRLLKAIHRISDKAEKIIDSAESVGSVFRNAAGPLAALKLVRNIVETVTKHTNKHKK